MVDMYKKDGNYEKAIRVLIDMIEHTNHITGAATKAAKLSVYLTIGKKCFFALLCIVFVLFVYFAWLQMV